MKKILYTLLLISIVYLCQAQVVTVTSGDLPKEPQKNSRLGKKNATWEGQNGEYLKFAKKNSTEGIFKWEKTAYWTYGKEKEQFEVLKFKKDQLTLATTYYSRSEKVEKYLVQEYKIVLFTPDTLIISPVGFDKFRLGRLNDKYQYVFKRNSNMKSPLPPVNFVRLHLETNIDFYVKVILDIDSTRKTRVQIIDDYNVYKKDVRSPLSKSDYKHLISLLEFYDINRFPEKYMYDNPDDIQCCRSFFEIEYSGQVRRSRGCTYFPFNYYKLENFLWRVISSKGGLDGPTIEL